MKKALYFFVCIVVGAFLILSFIDIDGKCSNGLDPVTDIFCYNEIKKKMSFQDDISHFPDFIPEDVKNVSMVFQPPFMQGGTFFQLKYRQQAQDIKSIRENIESSGIEFFSANIGSDKYPGGIRESDFFNESFEGIKQDDLDVYVLESKSSSDTSFKWNHGMTRGVAITKNNYNIIYWYSAW